MAQHITALHCPRCNGVMKAHCPRLCAWYSCNDPKCLVERMDIRRGLVMVRGRGVIKVDAAPEAT